MWPLEFTSRFGYPGFAICDALHAEGWASILKKMAVGGGNTFATKPGFAVGVVLTVPPFPHEYGYDKLSKGTPIFFLASMSADERTHLHFGEVEMVGEQLITSGSLGYVMVVTGIGDKVETAQAAAYALVRQVVIPNMRYRIDIGDKLIRQDLARLRLLGHYDV